MKKLRKFGAPIILALVFALTAFAGQTDTPPCSIPEPGQTDTPPCVQLASGDMNTPMPTSRTGNLGSATVAKEASLSEIAADFLLNFLPLF
jgi:hypothetical protein